MASASISIVFFALFKMADMLFKTSFFDFQENKEICIFKLTANVNINLGKRDQ
jgi:hypothetical protein